MAVCRGEGKVQGPEVGACWDQKGGPGEQGAGCWEMGTEGQWEHTRGTGTGPREQLAVALGWQALEDFERVTQFDLDLKGLFWPLAARVGAERP